ncbi:MAG TPA: cation transporter [Bosea sp. (in: a-proteobacteria)]|jgi:Co/Zn/Cd efflux system component|uniref:cation transporter n=1 Tax=Bosea sp. (in: a-proteobacteria) TaxID=1871050 RepID=UPI002E0EA0C9|nr:cation transporter [Bosea sp. (in: a-proteobacteria)]
MSAFDASERDDDVDARDRPGHDGEGAGARNHGEPGHAAPVDPRIGRAYRLTIWAIALGILIFAALVVAWALAIGNSQLLKDGVDWVYDVALYGIAAMVFGRDGRAEKLAALGIGAVMAVAGLHTLYDLWDKILRPRPIELFTLGFSAGSAILIAYLIVLALWRFRREPNPVIKATWLSSRNDTISTTGFALVGLAARLAPVRWPEYLLDLVVAGLCFQASWAIWRATRQSQAPTKAST